MELCQRLGIITKAKIKRIRLKIRLNPSGQSENKRYTLIK
jgi:hypothetical protein